MYARPHPSSLHRSFWLKRYRCHCKGASRTVTRWATEEKVGRLEEPATDAVALVITRETARSMKVKVAMMYEELATAAAFLVITRETARR